QELDGEKSGYSATATAYANIALIKYWGKRSAAKNLPAVGSISMTLDSLKTETRVRFDEALATDSFKLNGKIVNGQPLKRISGVLENCVAGKPRLKAEVVSENNFPPAAGLASSASGFAALALSASRAAGQDLEPKALSQLARKGSASAARSVYGGFAEMQCGNTATGEDDYAVPLANENHWDLRLLVAVLS